MADGKQSVMGSRVDVRLDGMSEAREHLRQAIAKLREDGVGPNPRDGWGRQRLQMWHGWAETLEMIERDIAQEQGDIADGK